MNARRRHDSRVVRLAYYDSLTGLPNRSLFKARLAQRLASARHKDNGFALHFLDLDYFKGVNDALGHPTGDLLLKEVAQRLRSLLRDADTVARFGGDEFAVIQPEIAGAEDAAALAAKIIAHLSEPYRIQGNEIVCGASVGVVLVPRRHAGLENLLAQADVALYKAKNSGRGRYAFHTDEMTRQVRREAALADRLEQAVRDDELFLHYQPQVELATGRVTAVEALVRWRHPLEGVLAPVEFVHLAERRGLVQLLGSWVLTTATAQVRRWLDMGLELGRIAINVSHQQVRVGTLSEQVLTIAADAGIDPGLLELEMTEMAWMEYGERYQAQAAALRDAGVRLTVDNFGTGFSSLTHLTRSGVSALKIDGELVSRITEDGGASAIVRAALAMAGALGMETVATGVETPEQAQQLVAMGCRYAQGNLFAPPMSDAALIDYLAADKASRRRT